MKPYKNRFGFERRDRQARIAKLYEKSKTFRALIEEWEEVDSDEARAEVRHLKTKLRTTEQQIRYIDVSNELDA